MFSFRPTSSRWMVWNGLLLLPPLVTYWPVTNGTVLPTRMLADWLSSVSRFGVDRMLASPVFCIARASTPRLMTLLPSTSTVPLTTPRLRPLPSASIEVGPVPVRPLPPRLVPPMKLVPPLLMLPAPVIHWMPNSAAACSLTSTIRLSTSTCARRWSSWSITSRRLRYSGSGAAMISELVAGSAWMVAPPAEYDTAWLPESSRAMRSWSPDRPPLALPDAFVELDIPRPVPVLPPEPWGDRLPPAWPGPPPAPPEGLAPGAELAWPASKPPKTSAMRVACALRM
ncbi:Uncharacterised protein [Achromobacter xylosoxidans]|nr:Uncharacterised protein [Achromobacter xylosoxidans]CUJ32372.1 Uncharacterised protein [Achromobacter xylosoxidans]CUJ68483.1 Uncharacterised protein [Achromobacter xylosoxidans]